MSIVLMVAQGPDATEVERIETSYESLAEAAGDEPANGVYLVARTYRGGQVLQLDAHFDRVERSAAAQGYTVRVPREQVRTVLREMLRELAPPSGDGRFRVTAVLDDSPWFRLAMEPAAGVDPDLLRRGVHCTLHRGTVRSDAEVKSTAWIAKRRALAAAEKSGPDAVYEHLLVRDDGAILEGSGSNFYACIGKVVHTAGAGVLQGIARGIVLTVVEEMAPKVTVDFRAVTTAELEAGAVDEAFITSSTRGVVPVRSVDSTELGPPGAITSEISRRYEKWLETHLRPL
ncbi:MAG: aminotransferase class IV [Alkalispirochaeta sp.]